MWQVFLGRYVKDFGKCITCKVVLYTHESVLYIKIQGGTSIPDIVETVDAVQAGGKVGC